MAVIDINEKFAEARALAHAANEAIENLLTLTRDTEPTPVILEIAQWIGTDGQAREGQLIQFLAQADRMKTTRGGLAPWITTHLDVTPHAARGIAQSAREIGQLPELTETLSSGRIGTATIRALTRTARAVKNTTQNLTEALTETLDLATHDGVSKANRHVRILEETLDPGSTAEKLTRQRARSFLRTTQCENGMYRIEVLLDPQRATTILAALDATVAAWIRELQYDHTHPVPEDVRSIEQLQAHALVRLAEVFLTLDSAQRGVAFTPTTLYHVPLDPNTDAGLAETAYTDLLPRTTAAPMGNPAAHLLEHHNGQPVLLDGKPIDENPHARLASPDQRTALTYRDRTCTHPGCTRPATWHLHAHHKIPHTDNGPTTLKNLTLLCPQHHTLTHHPHPRT